MNERWYMTLFRPGRPDDAIMLDHLRKGDPAVEAAGDRVEQGRRLAGPSLPASAGARRRGAGGVPFSAASGADLSPFGASFADWSNMVDAHAREPLPDYMREQPVAEGAEPAPRGLEPESASVPGFNSDMEMRSAMARARSSERIRAGTPTVADSVFLLIFGGESTQERANRELREDVEARRHN